MNLKTYKEIWTNFLIEVLINFSTFCTAGAESTQGGRNSYIGDETKLYTEFQEVISKSWEHIDSCFTLNWTWFDFISLFGYYTSEWNTFVHPSELCDDVDRTWNWFGHQK